MWRVAFIPSMNVSIYSSMWRWMNERRRVDRSSTRWHVLMEMENWINFLFSPSPSHSRLLFSFLFYLSVNSWTFAWRARSTRILLIDFNHHQRISLSDEERFEKCYNFLSERCCVEIVLIGVFARALQPAIWAVSRSQFNEIQFERSSSRLILLINIYISNLSMYIFTPHWWNHHPHRILMSKNISSG